jgi:outer membrane lipoprotein-sorting protein
MRPARYNRYFCFFLLSSILLTACKTKQQYIYSTKPVEDKNPNELFQNIIEREFSYQTFSAKLNMNLTSGKESLSSKANIRIVKDNALQISIQPLFGVEMFRFYINPDTLLFLDRMNKRYVLEPLDELKERYPVGFDFYTMQSFFSNALFISGKNEVEAADYRKFNFSRTSDHNYYLTAKDHASGIDYAFTVNGDDRITFTHLSQPERNQSLQWGYHNFALLNEISFPHKMNISLSTNSKKVDAELLFSDVVTNLPIELSKSVPNGYSRTSIGEIMKILSSNQ